jgi:hypothetical protein
MGCQLSRGEDLRRWVAAARRDKLLSKRKGLVYIHLGLTGGNGVLLRRLHDAFKEVEALSSLHARQALEPRHQRRRPGLVRCGDILTHLVDVERSGLADTIITAFSKTNRVKQGKARIARDENGTGKQLDLHSFILAYWNFCTVPILERPMARFLFDLYDVDESGALGFFEIKLMLQDMGSKNLKLLELVRERGAGMLSEEEFVDFCCRTPTFLIVANTLQMRMRQQVGHAQIWDALSIHRNTISLGHPFLSLRVILLVLEQNGEGVSTDEVAVQIVRSARVTSVVCS